MNQAGSAPVDQVVRKVDLRKLLLRSIGLVLLVALVWWFDPRAIAARFARIDITTLAFAVLLIIPMIGLKVTRWVVLLRCNGIEYPFSRASLAYCSSLFLGLLTPGRVGELAKALPVSRECNVGLVRVLPSVLADRLFDVLVLLVFATASLIVVWAPGSESLLLAGLGALGLLVLGLWPLMNAKAFGYLVRLASKLGGLSGHVTNLLHTLHEGFQNIRGGSLWLSLGLTVMAYVVFFAQCVLLAQAISLVLPLGQLIVAVSAGSIAGFLPISFSNIGTREAVLVAYLSPLGISPDQAITFSLLLLVAFNLSSSVLGAIAWWFMGHPALKPLVDQVSQQSYAEKNAPGRQE